LYNDGFLEEEADDILQDFIREVTKLELSELWSRSCISFAADLTPIIWFTFIKWSVLVVVVVICILDLLSNNSYKNRKKTKQLTAGQKPNTIAIWLYDMQKIVITVLFAASCIICLAFCPVR
jgi:NADH:ubiquinone oxidoreductase subunit 3 (subunit A)